MIHRILHFTLEKQHLMLNEQTLTILHPYAKKALYCPQGRDVHALRTEIWFAVSPFILLFLNYQVN